MSCLLEKLPEELSGNKINSDFRTSIRFEQLLLDKTIKPEDKILRALKLYYPEIEKVRDINQAIEDLVFFYQCGKKKNELANSKKEKQESKDEIRIYNYEFDGDYIATSFLEQYNIDLWDIDHLHWWKFKVLLENL